VSGFSNKFNRDVLFGIKLAPYDNPDNTETPINTNRYVFEHFQTMKNLKFVFYQTGT